MNWKEQLDKAVARIREATEGTSAKAQEIADKAKHAAVALVEKVRGGAVDAAAAFAEANRDPSALEIKYLNARLTVVSPATGLSISHPDAATLAVDDGQGNGVVINAAAEPAILAETIGTVTKVGENAWDLGSEDGVNVVVTRF